VPPPIVVLALLAGAGVSDHAAVQPRTFTAITWNVEQPQGRRLRGVIDFLISQDADVVALQEMYEGEAAALRSELEVRTSKPWDGRFYRGLMLLTKVSIAQHDELWMPYPDRYGPGRPALGVAIAIGGLRLHVFNAHLACCDHVESRQRQVDALIGWMGRFEGPAIVAGDFNAVPTAAEIGQPNTPAGKGMAAEYLDLWKAPGGETHRNPAPSRRIDYWFQSKGSSAALIALSARVLDVCTGWTFTRTEAGEGGVSCLADHKPVKVTFRIAPVSPAARGGAL
jgi:endonuclease/exonuclease/phosphatase family metal-dependent hydrolase